MSDYMFMLESHLNPDQNRVVAEVQAAASAANVNLFLTGGAMRDMLGGFQIRDLDFTIEGNAVKLGKAIAAKSEAQITAMDEYRGSVELLFGGSVTAEIGMARKERYTKPGARPFVTGGTIQEDLRRRDFTINAIALSLNRASKGLLLDPMNGLAELGRRELRTLYSTAFYDDPARLLRLVRFRVRLGYTVEEKTQAQFDNARAANVQQAIPPRVLCEELRHIAAEPNPGELVRALEQAGLLSLYSAAFAGAKLNYTGLAKLDKCRRMLPSELHTADADWGPFLYVWTEKLTPKEKSALAKHTEMKKAEVDQWQKLPLRAKKLESALKSARLRKPSQIFAVLTKAKPDEIVLLLYQSNARIVLDRIKNYFQKYLPLSQEITDAEVVAKGVQPGTPKFQKTKDEMVAARLDGRTRKPALPPVEIPPPAPMPRGRGAGLRRI
jgi:tRNA nucleotidyltransferase (CCA-adding enzyme)